MITAVAAPALLSNILRAQDGPFVIHKADFELRIKSSWLTERILSSLSIEVIPRFPSVGYNTNLLERLRAAQVLEANDASRGFFPVYTSPVVGDPNREGPNDQPFIRIVTVELDGRKHRVIGDNGRRPSGSLHLAVNGRTIGGQHTNAATELVKPHDTVSVIVPVGMHAYYEV
ncbi:MAG: hypothetical protein A3A83_03890 [Candidatus Doudnabacteria bacterium RIFCSPLOWO2_01_FULL_48_57]|nr:MAG: hypothetical protein A3K05_03060 [Candidatus Doudnabacteria bacterium RIFCSPHIGHO2_01_48_18]OGE97215.1 MAG: hypothetical protein A3A83_03890 [Candidatus Doudnabacteria bacterium RIFCSPLOWO2_01_FULL_48_57]OGF01888.1 MAG: hypothetical protein A3G07_00070 [Candidatus Doudnabacteria bacterium RIFCSPLOWO2_12_FULL_47_12]